VSSFQAERPGVRRLLPDDDRLTTISTTGVGLAAAALSFENLMMLAETVGFSEGLSWLYPVAVDLYALAATRVWVGGAGMTEKLRRWARASSFIAIACSVMGGGVVHLLEANPQLVAWVAAPASALPAVMLGLAVHLLVLLRVGRLEALGSAGVDAAAEQDSVVAAEPPNRVRPSARSELDEAAASHQDVISLPRPPDERRPTVRRREGAGTKKAAMEAWLAKEVRSADERTGYQLAQLYVRLAGDALHPATAVRYANEFLAKREPAMGA
jgi:hypothetical protein